MGLLLEDWVRRLRSISPQEWGQIQTHALFHTLPSPPDDWYSHLQFAEDTYTRNLVVRTEDFELLTVGWLGGQATPPHDHSGQRCWMWVVHGELSIQNFRATEDGKIAPLGSPQGYPAGSRLYIDDSLGWHAIENPTHKPAVSLHLHSKPFAQCHIYNEISKRIQVETLETVDIMPVATESADLDPHAR